MIQVAQVEEVQSIANVIKASILSCVADHQNDENMIADWLANKKPENIVNWIKSGVALSYKHENKVVGFFLATQNGEILLNYIEPDYQKLGFGKALLTQAELIFKQKNVYVLTCESTITAKAFYLHNSFRIHNDVIENGKIVGYKMTKNI